MADRPLCEFRGGARRSTRQGAGRQPEEHPHPDDGQPPERFRKARTGQLQSAQIRRYRTGQRRRNHSGRRRSDRRRSEHRRIRNHRRIRSGGARGRRRPLRSDRRHPRTLRPDQSEDHRRSRRILPRPDDRAGRGRGPPENPERAGADRHAGRTDARIPAGHGHALPDGEVFRCDHSAADLDFAAGLPDPDHDRRAAGRDRHRGHGPGAGGQRAGQERQGRGAGRRHRHAAAGQNRHDHRRRPPRLGVPSGQRHRL